MLSNLKSYEQIRGFQDAVVWGGITTNSYEASFATKVTCETTAKIAVGCMILAALPPAGIAEAFNSLKDMWDYYRPTEERHALMAPMAKKVAAKVVSKGQRAPLALSDE